MLLFWVLCFCLSLRISEISNCQAITALKYTRGADKSLARPGRTQATTTKFWVSYILFIIIIGGILVLFIYITRLSSNEIFSPSNKIHREVGRAKDLSALLYDSISTIRTGREWGRFYWCCQWRVPRLRMNGVIPQFPVYAFLAYT